MLFHTAKGGYVLGTVGYKNWTYLLIGKDRAYGWLLKNGPAGEVPPEALGNLER